MADQHIVTPGPIILRGVVGSTAHGLVLEGKDDRDEMGVCVEARRNILGLAQYEQSIFRSAAEREHRSDAPSQPGDLDLVMYGLRKYVRLALNGNPTILALLFLPPPSLITCESLGQALRKRAGIFASKRAGAAFIGYFVAQKQRLLGKRGQKRVHRPDLVEVHGYDTKYAMHMLRLGYQGIEYMMNGRLTLPMPDLERSMLMQVRRGKMSLGEVLALADDLDARLLHARDHSPLPPEPNRHAADLFLIDAYESSWHGGQS